MKKTNLPAYILSISSLKKVTTFFLNSVYFSKQKKNNECFSNTTHPSILIGRRVWSCVVIGWQMWKFYEGAYFSESEKWKYVFLAFFQRRNTSVSTWAFHVLQMQQLRKFKYELFLFIATFYCKETYILSITKKKNLFSNCVRNFSLSALQYRKE